MVETECNAKECLFESDIKEIKSDVKDVKRILNGNGKVGLVAKVEVHEKHIELDKKRLWDITTIVFRVVMGAMVGFIVFKVSM